jgi:rhodanese-related sulfurtransferase
MVSILTKTELEKLLEDKEEFTLIDVRTPLECDEMIPTAKNIPLNEIEKAFNAENEEFSKEYNFEKPKYTDFIICYCRSGSRSNMASELLLRLGYEK